MEKPRNILYTAFSDGRSPKGVDFKDLIDSSLNSSDDGIKKSKITALHLEAGSETHKPVIALAPKGSGTADFLMNLNPNGRPGFGLSNAATPDAPILFLDKETGNVSVGSTRSVGKMLVATSDSNGNVNEWGAGQFVVGLPEKIGGSSGGIGLSYSQTENTGYISSLSPSAAWRNLGIRALNSIFYSGGGEVMRITQDGKLGIGETNPDSQLEVRRDLSRGIGMTIRNDSTGQQAHTHLRLQNGSSDAEIFKNAATRIDDGGAKALTIRNKDGDIRLQSQVGGSTMWLRSDGFSGIGTKQPKSRWSVAGNLSVGTNIAGFEAAPSNGLLVQGLADFREKAIVRKSLQIGSFPGGPGTMELRNDGASPFSNRLIFGTDNTGWRFAISKRETNQTITDFLCINDVGRVGIGTDGPFGKLHVTTPDSDGNVGGWESGQVVIGKSDLNGPNSGGVAISYSNAKGAGYISTLSPNHLWRDLRLQAQNTIISNGPTEKARFTADGKLGIGADAPTSDIEIRKNIDGELGAKYVNESGGANAFSILRLEAAGQQGVLFKNAPGRSADGGGGTLTLRNDTGDLRLQAQSGIAAIRMKANGRIGLGVDNPQHFFHISAGMPSTVSNFGYYNQVNSGHYSPAQSPHTSIWAEGRIIGEQFNAISDRRIKTNFESSIGTHDLSKLAQLNILDYQYKDFVEKGTTVQKGLIAQEVQKVYPEAVEVQTEFIPNIFSKPSKAELENGHLNIEMEAEHELQTGDIVRFKVGNANHDHTVIVHHPKRFQIENWKATTEKLFVYGKQVEDFMVVDYNKVFCLGISATQELNRQVTQLKSVVKHLLKESGSPMGMHDFAEA